jgi:UDP-N-acetylmuramoyl-tripeptide--D-alanyl-D-alanine ligase
MLSVHDIIEATGGSLVSGCDRVFSDLSIDSRTIRDSELFVPIKGERYDGHDFAEAALNAGGGALAGRQWLAGHSLVYGDKPVIAVEDTLTALHDIARYVRGRLNGAVVAVAGSNGKTTTKELICSILSLRLKIIRTMGNLNNHIGVPLCMTRAADDTEVMVLEMGTNRPGDMDLLCGIATPDIGVVTNIGMEHLEGFGSLECIRDEELSILNYVRKIALNGDDGYLLGGISMKYTFPVTTYGLDNPVSEITASDIELKEEGASFQLNAKGSSIRIDSKLSGMFNIMNSLAAAAVARMLGFNLEDIKIGLEAYRGMKMRFEIRTAGGASYLFDAYNANPSSVKASVMELVRMAELRAYPKGGRSIAVLGDMLELGDYSISSHEDIGRLLRERGIGHFIGVGPLMKNAVSAYGPDGLWASSSEDAGTALAGLVRPGDIVLIKGSRGMKMERVMECAEKKAALQGDPAGPEGGKPFYSNC